MFLWPYALPVKLPEDTTSSPPAPLRLPLIPGPWSADGWVRFTSGSCSSLSSRTLRWPGAERVCTHACVCFASGNRKRAREKQMGPLSFPLAWKMKGEENRNKKRKQLWQDNSSLWGGSPPEGALQSVKILFLGAGYHQTHCRQHASARSVGHQTFPSPFFPLSLSKPGCENGD